MPSARQAVAGAARAVSTARSEAGSVRCVQRARSRREGDRRGAGGSRAQTDLVARRRSGEKPSRVLGQPAFVVELRGRST